MDDSRTQTSREEVSLDGGAGGGMGRGGGGENERRRASERVSERKQPKSEDGDTRYKVLNCLVHTHCQGVIPLCRYTQTLQRYFL